MISVVIPVYNAAATLGEQLDALADQTYGGAWEVILADNGSTDGSVSLARGWEGRVPGLRIVDASARRGPSVARNVGAAAATGEAFVFCDADDVVTPGWLAALADALNHDFVAGAMDYDFLNRGPAAGWRRFRSHVDRAPVGLDFMPYAMSANIGVRRGAFEAVGGFSERLRWGEDVDLSWRLQLAGYPLHFAPSAIIRYRYRDDLRSLWRQYLEYGSMQPLLYKRFRSAGLPRASVAAALYAYLQLVTRIHRLLRVTTRGLWIRAAAVRWGRVRGSIRERVLYL